MKSRRLIVVCIGVVFAMLTVRAESSESVPATQPSRVIRAGDATGDLAVVTLLGRSCPNMKIGGVRLNDTLDFLHEMWRVNMLVDWNSISAAGINRNAPITESKTDVSPATVLDDVLLQASGGKVDYGIFDGTVFISTPERLKELSQVSIQLAGSPDPKLQNLLDHVMPFVQVRGNSLHDCIGLLEDIGGPKIAVHWQKVRAAGIDSQTPITISVRNIKFSSVLELMLIQPGIGKLAYTANGDTITISTPEDLTPKEAPAGTQPSF